MKTANDIRNSQYTYTETLDKLSNDEDLCVKEGIASNPDTSTETLDKLSEDEDWGVRAIG